MKSGLSLPGILLATLLASGCASTRINVTPPAKPAAVPGNTPCYAINSAQVLTSAPMPGDWEAGRFGPTFVALAEERYPALFRRAPDAVPITVQVSIHQEIDQGLALGVYIGTLCIVGGIFQSLPWETEWQVSTQICDARGAPFATPKLTAVDRGWWSILTPLGLMEFPGESDAPKVSAVLRSAPGQMPVEHTTYVMQCAVDQMAAELLRQPAGALPAAAPVAPVGTPAASMVPIAPLPETGPVSY